MSLPTLDARPTHKALPLLRSELSRITHRRLFRVLALLLLGGIAFVSTIVFFVHSPETGWSDERVLQEQATAQASWEDCVASIPSDKEPERRCGQAPAEQPLNRFNYGGDDRYHAYQILPIVILGVCIAASAIAFIMGASAGGAEWSSRSMTLQLLFEPRRLRLLIVKWVSLSITTGLLAAGAILLGLAFGAVTASLRGTWDPSHSDFEIVRDELGQTLLSMGLRGLVLVVIACTIGYAIAMLVRNTGASLGVAFVYFVFVENVVRFALLRYGAQPFLLAENSVALLVPGGIPVIERIEDGQDLSGGQVTMQLTNLRAFLTLLGYTALLAVPAGWSFSRRDVG